MPIPIPTQIPKAAFEYVLKFVFKAYILLFQEATRWNRTISQQMAADSRAIHHIAIASKDIAEASKRDSCAMKKIGKNPPFLLHSPSFSLLKVESSNSSHPSHSHNHLPPRHLRRLPFQQLHIRFPIRASAGLQQGLDLLGCYGAVDAFRRWGMAAVVVHCHRRLVMEARVGADEEKAVKGD